MFFIKGTIKKDDHCIVLLSKIYLKTFWYETGDTMPPNHPPTPTHTRSTLVLCAHVQGIWSEDLVQRQQKLYQTTTKRGHKQLVCGRPSIVSSLFLSFKFSPSHISLPQQTTIPTKDLTFPSTFPFFFLFFNLIQSINHGEFVFRNGGGRWV